MRCRGEIMLDRVEDSLWVPIQSVFREGPIAYVHVKGEQGIEQRSVRLGRTGELQVEVLGDALAVGDRVLLRRPDAEEIAVRIPAEELAAARGGSSEGMRRGGGRPGAERQGGGRPGSSRQGGGGGSVSKAESDDSKKAGEDAEAKVAAAEGTSDDAVPAQSEAVAPVVETPAPAASS